LGTAPTIITFLYQSTNPQPLIMQLSTIISLVGVAFLAPAAMAKSVCGPGEIGEPESRSHVHDAQPS